MNPLATLDQRYVWHPFTQMKDWLKHEPIVVTKGQGAVLQDARGRKYLDANSSIWTNLHGHNHPKINAAIARQLKKVAHSSALGFANEPASLLAEKLVAAANPKKLSGKRSSSATSPKITKAFFSDDGSTAVEAALKMAYEYSRRTGHTQRPRFLSLQGAYHGDTVGAVSLGHIELFHKSFSGLLFKTDSVRAPYCYRCPYNRAKPERADAREYRKCNWECVGQFEKKFVSQKKRLPYSGFVFEPLMQGAAGMIAQPEGWLKRTTDIARGHGALLVADEVMTAFGRTGVSAGEIETAGAFASQKEAVRPDLIACAKGLTGGYLPMAATLATQAIFDAFLGEYRDFKTFFHGHSYTGNQLGASAALASMEILETRASLQSRINLENLLRAELKTLWALEKVGDIRQVGIIAGIELVKDWRTRKSFALEERAGIRVCEAMARTGVLTRPIGNVVVIMPPYCTTAAQLGKIFSALRKAIRSALT